MNQKFAFPSRVFCVANLVALMMLIGIPTVSMGQMKTWDGAHSIDEIEVTVVYFVPRDRTPLPDWRERVDYYCKRIETFHAREFGSQSKLKTKVFEEPFVSNRLTKELRAGDANFIFFQTVQEVDRAFKFGQDKSGPFPILLILSEINWKPLDDFYRLNRRDDRISFEGNYSDGRHFPGAESGGARATFLSDQRKGWGLVSGDGWRVPYSGTDCVVYHEGVGHTIGLPHPDANPTVMSLGQYYGWISQSSVDLTQKKKLGWKEEESAQKFDFFTSFKGLPSPLVPKPREQVNLEIEVPVGTELIDLSVEFQTAIDGPWIESTRSEPLDKKAIAGGKFSVSLGKFDRATPVGYRVRAKNAREEEAEIWGYFQVREKAELPPKPATLPLDLREVKEDVDSDGAIQPAFADRNGMDLLKSLKFDTAISVGDWTSEQGDLIAPKMYGARIELTDKIPAKYDLVVNVEPLDEPNGLTMGLTLGGSRFLALLSYAGADLPASAIENVDGMNVGNPTTKLERLFQKNRESQIVYSVREDQVTVRVDGKVVLNWKGTPNQLSLSDYWKTPNEKSLFIGAYDCSYRFTRITLHEVK